MLKHSLNFKKIVLLFILLLLLLYAVLFLNTNSVMRYAKSVFRGEISSEEITDTPLYTRYYPKNPETVKVDLSLKLVLDNTKLYVYTYEKSAKLMGEKDFLTGTVRFFVSDNAEYSGVFYFTVGGGANHYGYMSIKNQKLSFKDLWEENYASEATGNTGNIKALTTDNGLIEESKRLYKNNSDIDFIRLK